MYDDDREQSPKIGAAPDVARIRSDDNPLVRGVDLAEARARRLMITVALVLLPLTVVPGVMIWQSRDDTGARPAVTLVTAVTDRDAAAVTPVSSTMGADRLNKVPAHWQLGGTRHDGLIPVVPGTPAGSKIPLTVNSDGVPTAPYPLAADAGVTAVAVVVVLFGVVLSLLFAGLGWIRDRFDQRRDRMWDEAIHRFFN
ncbi:hypothetical protein [Williamsia sp. CHRR-6]|uniref:Rv1733c family protein n=1 Tax=Williamsia sp. CHRR-6 TaxID=2835871 RepID=UPI001BDADA33|nr:hypothetical protein [Williamsia sp. CHRR-6]MBT0567405.1 hypothetical protein [Williamsia sp. CHRR-6]